MAGEVEVDDIDAHDERRNTIQKDIAKMKKEI